MNIVKKRARVMDYFTIFLPTQHDSIIRPIQITCDVLNLALTYWPSNTIISVNQIRKSKTTLFLSLSFPLPAIFLASVISHSLLLMMVK